MVIATVLAIPEFAPSFYICAKNHVTFVTRIHRKIRLDMQEFT